MQNALGEFFCNVQNFERGEIACQVHSNVFTVYPITINAGKLI